MGGGYKISWHFLLRKHKSAKMLDTDKPACGNVSKFPSRLKRHTVTLVQSGIAIDRIYFPHWSIFHMYKIGEKI
jgi:hypothetical protein